MGPKKRRKVGNYTYLTVGFTDGDLTIIDRKMNDLGVDQSTAIRLLLRRGARGPGSSPFTPTEGTDHE